MASGINSPEYEDLKMEIRSVLISSQYGCSEQQLMDDFKRFNGNPIAVNQMGFNTLLDLLTSMPDVARIDRSRRPIVIHAVADENTKHIQKLVRGQKSKKPKMIRDFPVRTYSQPSRWNNQPFQPLVMVPKPLPYTIPLLPLIPPSNKNSEATTNASYNKNEWPSSNSNENQKYLDVTNGYGLSRKTPEGKMVASFSPKQSSISSMSESTGEPPMLDEDIIVIDDKSTFTEDDQLSQSDLEKAKVYGNNIIRLRKRIRKLLLDYLKGIWLTSIQTLYKKKFREELDLESFGLRDLNAMFDCVSDFVNCSHISSHKTTDELLVLKDKYIEAAKRESITFDAVLPTSVSILQKTNTTDPSSSVAISNETQYSPVAPAAFVSLDFSFKQLKYESEEPFQGFLGDIENPWNMRIGNVQYISKRDEMMAQLQNHYNQTSNDFEYVIPFDNIQESLSCVYYHTDKKKYYRSTIVQVEPRDNTDIRVLQIYLVDYGKCVHNLTYDRNSTELRYLHTKFSTLPTEVYDCRLANVRYPESSINWNDEARQFIIDCIGQTDFSVCIRDILESIWYVDIHIGNDPAEQLSHLLIRELYANECIDVPGSNLKPILQQRSTINHSYIDENLFLTQKNNSSMEFDEAENDWKYFIITIDRAYYFVKQPFTKRPCLPCFEVARLLGVDEISLPSLNLIRETEVKSSETYGRLIEDLRCKPESKNCLHIKRQNEDATIILYDLGSIRDYLRKIKFHESDVIDALGYEYDNYDRPGYWHEKMSKYMDDDNLKKNLESLRRRKDILNIRREQLLSLSKVSNDASYYSEILDVNHKLNQTNEGLHSMKKTYSPIVNNHSSLYSLSTKSSSSRAKMRETLYRIARPFDQQFSLNICFDHHPITSETFHEIDNDEFEGRMQDLYRITRNVIQFCILEADTFNESNPDLLNDVQQCVPILVNNQVALEERIDTYNYCCQIVHHFQPMIRRCVQRINLMDII